MLPSLDHILTAMHRKLAENHDYPADVKEDLDLYLTVARSLLGGHPHGAGLARGTRAAALVEQAERGSALTEESLFGRERMIDFSQYAPRGHYAKSERLGRFFRAAMWLSRVELNLVSRSSRSSQPGVTTNPEETPREAVDALALADLADAAGVLAEIGVLDRGWGALAGGREDVPLEKLSALVKALGGGKALTVPGSFETMKKAIGSDFKRTIALHYMPQGSTDLPVIATMLGPRIVPDSAAIRPLVHGALSDRYDIGAADVWSESLDLFSSGGAAGFGGMTPRR